MNFPWDVYVSLTAQKFKKITYLNLHQHSYPSSYSYKSFQLVSSVKTKIAIKKKTFLRPCYEFIGISVVFIQVCGEST